MLSEKEKELIRGEVREILARFGKTLDSVPASKRSSPEERALRTSREGLACDSDFRKRMFANAPKISGDCIVAEKARW